MKKSSWKLVLCLALAVVMLACTALAATAPDVAAASGATVSINDGKLTVTVSGLTAGKQYALLQVKVQSDAATAADLLANHPAPEVKEENILYIDQAAADGTVTFANFLPKSMSTSLFVLGGGDSAQVVGAMVTQGVTVSGTVTAKGATSGTATVAVGEESAQATIGANGTGTYEITVPELGEMSVSMTNYVTRKYTLESETQNAEIWLKGDANGDGRVNLSDYGLVLRHVKKTGVITDEYTLACSDTNDDQRVNLTDYGQILRHVKKTGSLW